VERCELSIVEGKPTVEGEEVDEDEDSLESKLIVRLHCKHGQLRHIHTFHLFKPYPGVVKTHRLLLLTSVSLMAPGVPDATNESRLTIGPKPLRDLIDHFPAAKAARSDPQLVWTFEDEEVGLKSMESSIDSRGTSVTLPSGQITHGHTGKGQLSTELTISTGEFDVYDIYETPTTIAFHLREFNVGLVTIPL